MKKKMPYNKYLVTIEREIRHVAEVEVECESEDAAQQLAEVIADEHDSGYWREDSVLSQTFKVKVMS